MEKNPDSIEWLFDTLIDDEEERALIKHIIRGTSSEQIVKSMIKTGKEK